MPLRGESVGTAYIRLIADGSGIPDDIRDSLDDADGRFADAGSRDAKAYKKGLAEELEKHDDHALRDAFNKALIADDSLDEFFRSTRWHNTEQNFRARFGGLGQAAADEIRKKFLKGGTLDGIENDIERVTARINNIAERAIVENARVTEERAKEAESFEKRFRAAMEESSRVSRQVSRDNVANLEGLRRTLERFHPTLATFGSDLQKAHTALSDNDRTIRRSGSIFSRFAVTMDHIADGVGRAFGKGSRSELLNFTGSFVAGFTSLVGLPFKVLGNLSEFSQGFKVAFKESGEFFSSVKAGFTGMAKDAEGGATALSQFVSGGLLAIPLLAIALVGVVTVLSVVSALISGIVAALTALVATVAFGIVGALAPLVGLLAPIAVGIGTIVLGVTNLDDKAKKALKDAVQPLIDGLRDLGEVGRNAFLGTFDRSLSTVTAKLKSLNPLVEATGAAFGDIANNIVDSFGSPTLTRFINQMTIFIPQALESLATSAGNVTGAILEIFTDSIPLTRRFLGGLEDVTKQFQDFVTQNPQKVKEFLAEAAQSARILGKFLLSVVHLFSTLVTTGRTSGNNIFKSLTENIEHFNDILQPKKTPTVFDEAVGGIKRFQDNADKIPTKSPLEDWFQHGQQTAEDLGNIAVSLGEIADALDSPEGRKNQHDLLVTLAGISALAGPLARIANFSFSASPFFGLLTGALNGPASATAGVISDVAHSLRGFAQSIGAVEDKLTFKGGLSGKIGSFLNSLGNLGGGKGGGLTPLTIKPPSLAWIPNVLSRIRTFATSAAAPFSLISSRWQSTMSSIENRANTAAGRVAGFLTSIPGRLGGLAGRFRVAAAGWTLAILHEFSQLPGQILGFFRGLGQDIVNAIGSISIPIHFDVPSGFEKFLGPAGLLLHKTASGGLFDGAQFRIIGEAGPEAVVPLTGPLNQVDPAVRWLSQIARGMIPTSTSPSGTGAGKTINNEWHITTPTEDARAVANELLNAMVATAY